MIRISKPKNLFGIEKDKNNLYSYSPKVLGFLEYMANNWFYIAKNKTVLEVGPSTGWFTHTLLHCKPKHITSVERYHNFYNELVHLFFNIKNTTLIHDDIYYYLSHYKPKFDIVVALGVVYHFTDPIGLLEKIVNYCKPEYILIDSPDGTLNIVEEPGNPGDRQNESDFVSSNITITVPIDLLITVLEKYGYELIKREDISNFGIFSKEESHVLMFQRCLT